MVYDEKLSKEIAKDLENLKTMEPGSAEKSKEVANIDTLYRLNLEAAKLEQSEAENYAKNIREADRLRQENRRQYIHEGVEIFKVGAPLIVYGICYATGLKFEETGAFTSQTVKGLLTKVKFFK